MIDTLKSVQYGEKTQVKKKLVIHCYRSAPTLLNSTITYTFTQRLIFLGVCIFPNNNSNGNNNKFFSKGALHLRQRCRGDPEIHMSDINVQIF